MKNIIVILGQTATGKSSLAVKIAKKFDGEIISADSRQVYKGLDVGTGKITEKEMKGISHHLLDVANPKNIFSAQEYQKLAISAIADIVKHGKIPIICGGTGFYIDTITRGITFPEVPPSIKLRKTLEKKSEIELFKILKKLDSVRAKNIQEKNEIKNKVRLIRAIEIAKALGKVPQITVSRPLYKFIKVGLCLPEAELKNKVKKRVESMFDKKNRGGLLNEIKKLKKIGVSNKRLRELGFEYFEPTPEKVVKKTLDYAKRQMTWFKRDKEIRWFRPEKYDEIEKFILNIFPEKVGKI